MFRQRYLYFFVLLFFPGVFAQQPSSDNPVAADESVLCAAESDVVFLIDTSFSIKGDWNRSVVPFISNVIGKLNVSRSSIVTAVTTFSNKYIPRWTLDGKENDDPAILNRSMTGLRSIIPRGNTIISGALSDARKQFLDSKRNESIKLVVILTDGQFSETGRRRQMIYHEAKLIRALPARIITIGVGSVDKRQLSMVSCGHVNGCSDVHIFHSFSELESVMKSMTSKICSSISLDAVCSSWGEWSECSQTCGPGIRERHRHLPITEKPPILLTNGTRGKTCEELHEDEIVQHEVCEVKPCPTTTTSTTTTSTTTTSTTTTSTTTVPLPVPDNHNGNRCLSEWTPWSECAPCGSSVQERHRSVLYLDLTENDCFEKNVEYSHCNSAPCKSQSDVIPPTPEPESAQKEEKPFDSKSNATLISGGIIGGIGLISAAAGAAYYFKSPAPSASSGAEFSTSQSNPDARTSEYEENVSVDAESVDWLQGN